MTDETKTGQLLVPTGGAPAVRGIDSDYIPLFDAARLDQMLRIAELMAKASAIPEHLKVRDLSEAEGRPAPNAPGWQHRQWELQQPVELGGTIGNCLMIVNQALRWRMDPFALAMSTFRTPNGQMGYEGKAVAAALDSVLGIGLKYKFFGEEGTLDYGVEVSGPDKSGDIVTVKGTVKQWATYDKGRDGANPPMKQNWKVQPADQLIYRGTRQWARRYRPGVILGIYTEDEMDALRDAAEIQEAPRTIAGQASGVAARLAGAGGFDHGKATDTLAQLGEGHDPETGELLGKLRESVAADRVTVVDHLRTAEAPKAKRTRKAEPTQTVATGNTPPGTATGAPANSTSAPGAGAQTPAALTAAETSEAPKPASVAPDAGPIIGGAAENSTGTTQEESPGIEPAVLREYSDTLLRATTTKGMSALDGEFFGTADRQRPTDPTSLEELRAIYSIHLKRVKKEIDDATAAADLKEVIGD